MRSFSKAGPGAVSATTMATTTFPVIVVSVLAAPLIDEFEISRAQLGLTDQPMSGGPIDRSPDGDFGHSGNEYPRGR